MLTVRWIIQQLSYLYGLFEPLIVAEEDNKCHSEDTDRNNTEEKNGASGIERPFYNLLLYDDDESSSDEEHEDEVGVQEAKGPGNHRDATPPPPTDEAIQHEERSFAVACALMEVHQTRIDLQHQWKDWNTAQQSHSQPTTITGEDEMTPVDQKLVGELVGISCASNYAIHMLKTTIVRTSLEFDCADQFDQLFRGEPGASTAHGATATFSVGDEITLQKLTRAELNGRKGKITGQKTEQEGRYPVQLFGQNKKMLIKPENIVRSDDTFYNLQLVHTAIRQLDLDSPDMRWIQASATHETSAALLQLFHSAEALQFAIQGKDLPAALHLIQKCLLPLLCLYAIADYGPSDPVLRVYLREFKETRKVTFHLAFAVLVMVDAAFLCSKPGAKDSSMDMMLRVLLSVCQGPQYDTVIQTYKTKGLSPQWFEDNQRHNQFFVSFWSRLCYLFPSMSGDILYTGLRYHFVAMICLPYDFHQGNISIVHVYRMLLTEGYLKNIDDLDAFFAVHQQRIWFRSGLPTKGKARFVSSWQFSAGSNTEALKVVTRGYRGRGAGKAAHYKDIEGYRVKQISQLVDIMQRKTIPPSFDRFSCLEQLRVIAREECTRVFLAPVMQVGIKLWDLPKLMTTHCIEEADDFILGTDYGKLARKMDAFNRVCFWGLSLADDKTDEAAKQAGLAQLANCFEVLFR